MDTDKNWEETIMDTYENENPGLDPVQPMEPVIPVEPAAPAELAAPAESAKGRRRKILGAVALSVAFVAMIGVVVGCVAAVLQTSKRWENEVQLLTDSMNNKVAVLEEQLEAARDTGLSVSGTPNASADGLTPAQVYAQNKMAVVAISCSTKYGSAGTATSSGSGFVLTADGYVVTNCHVVDGADTVTVVMLDGREYEAKVKGYDQSNDIAVLKVDAEGLQTVQLGRSSDLIIGDMVVAIGNPLGELTSTQTVGYISGKDRDVSTDGTLINMLQTDAAINPGNSGGPLFNMKGEVVGITTAKYSGTTSSGASIEGIGFAIPIDDVTGKLNEIRDNGYVSSPYMGISVDDRYAGMGAFVVSVEPDGGAAAAGVRPGDLIVGLGDREITCISDLTPAMKPFKVGDSTTVTVFRGRQTLELTITFGERPHTTVQPSGSGDMPSSGSYEDWFDYFFGDGNG